MNRRTKKNRVYRQRDKSSSSENETCRDKKMSEKKQKIKSRYLNKSNINRVKKAPSSTNKISFDIDENADVEEFQIRKDKNRTSKREKVKQALAAAIAQQEHESEISQEINNVQTANKQQNLPQSIHDYSELTRKYTSTRETQIINPHIVHLARKQREKARQVSDSTYIPLAPRDVENEDDPDGDEFDIDMLNKNQCYKEVEPEKCSIIEMKDHRHNQEAYMRDIENQIRDREQASSNSDSDSSTENAEMRWEEQQIRKAMSYKTGQPIYSKHPNPLPKEMKFFSNHILYNTFAKDAKQSDSNKEILGKYVKSIKKYDINKLKNLTIDESWRHCDTTDVMCILHDGISVLEQQNIKYNSYKEAVINRMDEIRLLQDVEITGNDSLHVQFNLIKEITTYINILDDCFTQKVILINHLENRTIINFTNNSKFVISRRRQNIKDEASSLMGFLKNKTDVIEDEHQLKLMKKRLDSQLQRSLKREEKRNLIDKKSHYDGYSSDDLLGGKNLERSKTTICTNNYLQHDCGIKESRDRIFDDVAEEYTNYQNLFKKITLWVDRDAEFVKKCGLIYYVGDLISMHIRNNHITWNPLVVKDNGIKFHDWYKNVDNFYKEIGPKLELDASDVDKIFCYIIDATFMLKLASTKPSNGVMIDLEIVKEFDALSKKKCTLLRTILNSIFNIHVELFKQRQNYPNTCEIFKLIEQRIKLSIDEDLYVPLFPIKILESRDTDCAKFHSRQFFRSLKLLENVMILSKFITKTFFIECIINNLMERHLILSFRYDCVDEFFVVKCSEVASKFQKHKSILKHADPSLQIIIKFINYLAHDWKQNFNVNSIYYLTNLESKIKDIINNLQEIIEGI
ncbi:hypothetical protein A3Q56_01261 [Intoshia linei]|uniref:GCF C-terminal domain-containing protein n=1 Tax=Intoshia linei TaxID=1819745 RepID=A0A177B9K6_9BILA|nr:hypothetical protein A3Q56_01261 [Intoshia linei]